MKSNASIANSYTVLRITRWISLIEKIKYDDKSGGNVYAIHEEPLLLQEVFKLDKSYKTMLIETANSHRDRRIKNLARFVLEQTEHLLSDASKDIKHVDPLEKIENRNNVKQYFESIQNKDPNTLDAKILRSSFSYYAAQKGDEKPVNLRSLSPSLDSELGDEVTQSPSLEFELGDEEGLSPSPEFELGDRKIIIVNKNNKLTSSGSLIHNPVQNLNRVVQKLNTSSSYIYKRNKKEKTTTTVKRSLTLHEPNFLNEYCSKQEINKIRVKLTAIPEENRQDILDELSERMRTAGSYKKPKTEFAVRNPLGLLSWMVANLFNPDLEVLTSLHLQLQERREKEVVMKKQVDVVVNSLRGVKKMPRKPAKATIKKEVPIEIQKFLKKRGRRHE